MENEIWKDIIGYEGKYQVSNLGRVFSFERNGTKAHFMKPKINRCGYVLVPLTKNKKVKWMFVHKLVLQTFIPNPNNKKQGNHIDGNKLNNCVDNLEWVTPKENIEHAYRTGLKKTWSYKIAQIKNGQIIKIYDNAIVASKETGIYISSIYRSANFYHTYREAGGYKWTYIKDIDNNNFNKWHYLL